MKLCVIPVKIVDHKPTVLKTQKLIPSLFFHPLCLPLSFFPPTHYLPHFFRFFCAVWFAQHASSCKLICTANQIWVSVCQISGFIPATTGLWCSAVEFLIVIGRHFCFLTCCCFDVRCSEVSSSSLIVTIPTFPQSIFSQSFYVQNFIVLNSCCMTETVCQSLPVSTSVFLFSFGPPGRRKSTDWLSLGQLRRHVGTDHWRLSERLAESTNGGGGHFQRYSFTLILTVCLYSFNWFELTSCLCLCRLAAVAVVCDRWKTCCEASERLASSSTGSQ